MQAFITYIPSSSFSRKWKQQQQKAEVLSSRSYNSNQTFSYIGTVMNGNNGNPYHLTMEDRMRWAQISDVIKNISAVCRINFIQHYFVLIIVTFYFKDTPNAICLVIQQDGTGIQKSLVDCKQHYLVLIIVNFYFKDTPDANCLVIQQDGTSIQKSLIDCKNIIG